jgi:hypothetical protein
MVARLVKSLRRKDVDIYVYDDGSDVPVEIEGATVYRYKENAGKWNYWIRVHDMFRDALKADDWDALLWLPDDVELSWWSDNAIATWEFWDDLEYYWEILRDADPLTVCLNPLALRHHPCEQWVPFEPVPVLGHEVYQTQWMDCCGLVDRRFVEVAMLLANTNPYAQGISSGVGKRLSIGMDERGFHMYQVADTLLTHGDHESVMHPERKTELLT